jgi:hypothetical protein
MFRAAAFAPIVVVLFAGCSSDFDGTPPVGTEPDAQLDASVDEPDATADPGEDGQSDLDVAEDVIEDVIEDVDPPYVPSYGQAESTLFGSRRGRRIVRGIIHNHTIYSHDACDGQPQIDGQPNTQCLADLREGICSTKQDFVFTTDHEELAAEVAFEELSLVGPDDEAITKDGAVVANRMTCPDGFRPLLMPGGEFGIMPIGMERHLDLPLDALAGAYDEVTPERVASLRETGAVVLQAHTESKPLESLRELGLDGFEIYNLHANIAPNIREEFLDLPATGFFDALVPFLAPGGPPGDLGFLAFASENMNALGKFDTLLAEGQHLVGTAGTDAHRNVLPLPMPDGERLDSFRRMMRFFSNHLLVDDLTPDGIKEAVRSGRLFAVFEILGAPMGFDYFAETNADETFEMGDAVPLASAPTLRLIAPTVDGIDGASSLTLTILRSIEGGADEVMTGNGDLAFTPTEPGAYRAVVRITPAHLRAGLRGSAELADHEIIWIYANPIYVD